MGRDQVDRAATDAGPCNPARVRQCPASTEGAFRPSLGRLDLLATASQANLIHQKPVPCSELVAAEPASAVDHQRDLNRERPRAMATTEERPAGPSSNARDPPTRAAASGTHLQRQNLANARQGL